MTTQQHEAKFNEFFREKRVAILGYGSQGRAHAMNLRDSGVDVVVGLRPGGKTWEQAESDGFRPVTPEFAVKDADVVAMLMPDMAQQDAYRTWVEPNMKSGAALMFAHGLNVHYKMIKPAPDVDVVLIAPKAPGALVRRQYEEGRGVPCLVAVHQDATGTARDVAYGYAHGLGCTRAGVIETTFGEETETDLFGEQAVLCGGVTELVAAGFETLVEAGYQPEVAYFECLHELKLIVDLLYEGGFARMHEFVSETAKYGDLTRGPRVVDDSTRQRMREILDEVRNGKFAKEWTEEYKAGRPRYNELLQKDLNHPIEKVGRELRAQMSWLQQKPQTGTSRRRSSSEVPQMTFCIKRY
jgi:ketol-acid reductoisomerase